MFVATAAYTSDIVANRASIATNANNILVNSAAIDINTRNTQLNAAAISANAAGLQDVREGSAALASIPDLYLGSGETWSISGGVASYDDGFGGNEFGFGGGIQLRGKASDKWSVGLAGALSGESSIVRIQARIGN